MAYMNQEKKAIIAAKVKPILKKYGVKGSLRVRNHSTIVLTLKSGKIDFVENFIETDNRKNYGTKLSQDQINLIRNTKSIDVNPYWYKEHFDGKALKFMNEIFPALKSSNWYDRSDAQTDYFDTAYYVSVNVGLWNKPYIVQ